MSRRGISLGRIFGIPIQLDYSWFLIFGLITWTLAIGYFPAEFRGWPTWEYWVVGFITSIFFFGSVLLHELGHSVVALHYGIPVSGINLFIFGGVSQIEKEPQSAGVEFVLAIVGPLVSFAIAGVFFGLQLVFTSFAPFLAFARYLAYINALLGVFNLIPGFPLDGGRVFRSIVWALTGNPHRATSVAGTLGRFIGFAFILFGVYEVIAGNFIDGLWIGFIGWFLESAAGQEMQQQKIQDLLAGHTVSQAMSYDYAAVPPDLTIQELVDRHILGNGHRSFVVEEQQHVDGLLTLHDIRQLPREQWPTTRVKQAMIPWDSLKRTEPNADLWQAIEEMNHDGVNQLPVIKEGEMLGMLRREDIISYLRNLREFSKN
jgi:Zn-dependent protease/CBS domain-containing protein